MDAAPCVASHGDSVPLGVTSVTAESPGPCLNQEAGTPTRASPLLSEGKPRSLAWGEDVPW